MRRHWGSCCSSAVAASSLSPGGRRRLPALDRPRRRRYGFEYATIANPSRAPARVESLHLAHPPGGTVVVGYRLLSTHDTRGLIGASTVGTADDLYTGFPDYLPRHPLIPAKSGSPYYAIVIIKVVGPVTSDGSGWQVTYGELGISAPQTSDCQLSLDSANR